MFGHQDDVQQPQNPAWDGQAQPDPAAMPVPTVDPAAQPVDNSSAAPAPANDPQPAAAPLLEPQASDGYLGTPAAPAPASSDITVPDLSEPAAPADNSPADTSTVIAPTPAEEPMAPPDLVGPTVPVADSGSDDDGDLLDIKQHALQQLSPLVGQLDQSPEEKFRTTMMMIQASDNQDLIKEAYEAANSIADEKARAQALLDIVNEINYFTQQPKGE